MRGLGARQQQYKDTKTTCTRRDPPQKIKASFQLTLAQAGARRAMKTNLKTTIHTRIQIKSFLCSLCSHVVHIKLRAPSSPSIRSYSRMLVSGARYVVDIKVIYYLPTLRGLPKYVCIHTDTAGMIFYSSFMTCVTKHAHASQAWQTKSPP